MNTLGLAPTEIWVSHSDRRLTAALVYFAKLLNMPVSGMNIEQVGSTDSAQFAARKIPSITIHSLTQEAWKPRILHTAKDKISADGRLLPNLSSSFGLRRILGRLAAFNREE
jgi:hypothetical protein